MECDDGRLGLACGNHPLTSQVQQSSLHCTSCPAFVTSYLSRSCDSSHSTIQSCAWGYPHRLQNVRIVLFELRITISSRTSSKKQVQSQNKRKLAVELGRQWTALAKRRACPKSAGRNVQVFGENGDGPLDCQARYRAMDKTQV